MRHNVDKQNADQTVCQQAKCQQTNDFFFVGDSAPTSIISQLRICRLTPLPPEFCSRFGSVLIRDAQCAESNEKSIVRFLFLSYRENASKIGVFSAQK